MISTITRATILILLGLYVIPATAIESEKELPGSLQKWYKPQNKRQVWLHTMFAMRRELQAIEHYLQKSDIDGIQQWGEKFITHYRKLPEMVPEWEKLSDTSLTDSLTDNITSHNFSGIRATLEKLKNSCQACHDDYQLLASIRYRSPDFADIKVDSGTQTYSYIKYMSLLSHSVNQVSIAAEDGYWQEAATASNQLRRELEHLIPGCSTCHKDKAPVERILGASLLNSLQLVDNAISNKDLKNVKRKLGEAAVTACARCHGVHRSLYEIRKSLFQDL